MDDELVLHVYAEDLRSGGSGLRAAYLDVAFDSESVTVTGSPHFDGVYKTERRAVVREGVLDNTGAIAENAADVGSGRSLLYTIPFTVKKTGTITLQSRPAANNPDYAVSAFGDQQALDPAALRYGSLSIEVQARSPWQNATNRFDVDNNNVVDVEDFIAVQNNVRDRGERLIDAAITPSQFWDVNGDFSVTNADVDAVVAYLNEQIAASAEGSASGLGASEVHSIPSHTHRTFTVHLDAGRRLSARLMPLAANQSISNLQLSLISPYGVFQSFDRHDRLGNPVVDFVATWDGDYALVVTNFGDA